MKRIINVALILLLVLCSCKADGKNSDEQASANAGSVCYPPLVYYEFYKNDFRYSSIDEFKDKFAINGADELFVSVTETGKPKDHDEKRYSNIDCTINNCIYEVYYKGEKLELQENVGFNIHLGNEDNHNWYGWPSYCDYFVKFTHSKLDGAALVRVYELSRIQETWDRYMQEHSYEDAGYTLIQIPYNGNIYDCLVSWKFDSETGEWIERNGVHIYLKYNNALIYIDFAPFEYIEDYAYMLYREYGIPESKTTQELALGDSKILREIFPNNLFEYFEFSKVEL